MGGKRIKYFCAALCALLLLCGRVRAQEYDCAGDRHDSRVVETIEATAARDGHIKYECRLCGYIYMDILFATDHAWGEWVVDIPATCTEEGLRHRICTRGMTHEEYAAVPAAGHSYAETRGQDGCGLPVKVTYTCTDCGHAYTETLPGNGGHAYTEIRTAEPACEIDGVMTYACACGESYTEPIPATGHAYDGWVTELAAQPGIEGSRYRECANGCGIRITETIPALPRRTGLTLRDAVIGSVNVGIIMLVLLVIAGNLTILRWSRINRRRIDARLRRAREREERDGFDAV